MQALVIAGTASGVGKTTVATGLIAALVRRGLTVQPFKVGPDYIDPSYHARAAGRPCRNLDSWMLGPDLLRDLFARAAGACDVAVVEGVMGLYDGKSGGGEVGSTAHVAKLIGAPVVLVVDAAKSARSAAAVTLGFRTLDPELHLAGVILNNVASPGHYAAAAEPIEREAGLPVLGQLGRDPSCRLEERYLGLVPTTEGGLDDERLARLATLVADGVDIPRLLALASRTRPSPESALGLFPTHRLPRDVRIAVARDEAFSFYYQDNLDLLEAWGAEIVSFSPAHDAHLPTGASAVYLGGGFPELFAAELARNATLRADLRQAAEDGMPIYAECGGLLYLAEGLTDQAGRRHEMAGVLPGWSTLEGGHRTLGYREVAARRDSILLEQGERIRGHEFHWSRSEPPDAARAAYDVLPDEGRLEGYVAGNLLASYVHLHFGSDPRIAPRFVEAAREWAARSHRSPGGGVALTQRSAGTSALSQRARAGGEGVPQSARSASPLIPGPLLRRHGLPPDEIEALSMRRIVEQAGSRLPVSEPARSLVARLAYAGGDLSLIEKVSMSDDAVEAAVASLGQGASIAVDVGMVAAALTKDRLQALRCQLHVAVGVEGAAELAQSERITRTAAGVLLLGERLDGAVVAIGNAPTALLALLDLVAAGVAHPAVAIGMPVGFVAAAESKAALATSHVPYVLIHGTRGGSALAAAALNHCLRLASRRGPDREGEAAVLSARRGSSRDNGQRG